MKPRLFCNNLDCNLRQSCFRFLLINSSKDLEVLSKNKCLNYIAWQTPTQKEIIK